jgi:hypothetical protein
VDYSEALRDDAERQTCAVRLRPLVTRRTRPGIIFRQTTLAEICATDARVALDSVGTGGSVDV